MRWHAIFFDVAKFIHFTFVPVLRGFCLDSPLAVWVLSDAYRLHCVF